MKLIQTASFTGLISLVSAHPLSFSENLSNQTQPDLNKRGIIGVFKDLGEWAMLLKDAYNGGKSLFEDIEHFGGETTMVHRIGICQDCEGYGAEMSVITVPRTDYKINAQRWDKNGGVYGGHIPTDGGLAVARIRQYPGEKVVSNNPFLGGRIAVDDDDAVCITSAVWDYTAMDHGESTKDRIVIIGDMMWQCGHIWAYSEQLFANKKTSCFWMGYHSNMPWDVWVADPSLFTQRIAAENVGYCDLINTSKRELGKRALSSDEQNFEKKEDPPYLTHLKKTLHVVDSKKFERAKSSDTYLGPDLKNMETGEIYHSPKLGPRVSSFAPVTYERVINID
jgi:hypothetical protein